MGIVVGGPKFVPPMTNRVVVIPCPPNSTSAAVLPPDGALRAPLNDTCERLVIVKAKFVEPEKPALSLLPTLGVQVAFPETVELYCNWSPFTEKLASTSPLALAEAP